MRKVSITEALVELKLYDKKINDAIAQLGIYAIAGKRKGAATLGTLGKIEEFEEKSKALYQKVTDLIRNRDELKAAIVESNAKTYLDVNGVNMTRAQAIEMKNSISYKKTLLNRMKATWFEIVSKVNAENKKVDSKIEEMKLAIAGRDSARKLTAEDLAFEGPYRDNNEFELIDPLKLQDKMLALEAEIDGFESSVDSALVISNSTTFIEVA